MLMWNSVLRSILQSFLKTSIGAVLALSLVKFTEEPADIANASQAIILVTTLAVLPFVFMRLLQKRKSILTQ